MFEDENVMNLFGMTKGNSPKCFFKKVHVSSSFAYCIFSSDKIIGLIENNIEEKNRNYLIDATFKVCPFGDFKQLLIIYIKHMQKITPFIFVLMTRKTELCYQHLFLYIDSNICCLKGASFISDYEKAMRNALKKLHPSMNFFACWFHFTQACKKTPGFEKMLNCNKHAYVLFLKFLYLPLLPATKIVEAFNMLKCQAKSLEKIMFSPFLKYFEKQWLKKEGPENISVFKRSTRTTGSVEAYNLNLGNKIRAKGHFFKFVQCLIDAEFEKSREFALLFQNGGVGNQPITKQLRNRAQKIMDAMELFDIGEIDIQGFLTRTVSLSDPIEKKDIFNSVDDMETNSSELNSSTSSISSDGSNLSQLSDTAIVQMNPCNVCLLNPKSVLLRPCNHVNVCGICWDKIVENNSLNDNDIDDDESGNLKPKCPSCNQPVDEAIRNVFIYN
ncbi:uncharacterized protein LOC123038074 isoform X1 [Drosophila rhopaloa]|uniref:RING-type domain-containing protein n=1 Tax=Drosophila rhopaloa TaxID=1041015 RepID=A0ABM5JFA1_DRORH|nr:uncharacterized protein LOC123038074 isoform X1 [Drosophila rhopaloa]